MIFVIGGLNTDITGTPTGDALLPHDSNIAHICVSVGGVGRNMAETLTRLGFSVEFVTPMGDDFFADMQQRHCEALGISLYYAPRITGSGGVYLCVNDAKGDMFIAMNDMRICEHLTPSQLPMSAINHAEACVLDANIPADCLLYLAQNTRTPLFADPVSVNKTEKLIPILPRLYAIKPNRIEAEALTGESDPLMAARALVRMGVRQAYVSLGSEGMVYADVSGEEGFCPALPATVINTTGAGDCATAAICAGSLWGLSIQRTAAFACRAAALTITSESAVSEVLSSLRQSI